MKRGAEPQRPGTPHSLQGFDELPRLHGRRVDDLVDVLAVAVCIGGGDVDEGLEVGHPLGQAQELLRRHDVQLQRVSAGGRRGERMRKRRDGEREGKRRARKRDGE